MVIYRLFFFLIYFIISFLFQNEGLCSFVYIVHFENIQYV